MAKAVLPKECRYIARALRRIWSWSVERKQAKLRKVCDNCKKKFGAKDRKEIDHISPVGQIPRILYEGWDKYIKRMFVPLEQLATLCHACHGLKSSAERRKNK